jgi:glycosyltransferase involved in cell wall biosynthesis
MAISGLIIAKNEARLIGQVVRNLRTVADEVVVADMASVDDTADLARAAGARVLSVPDFGFLEPARALAEAECSNEWILNLDADELLPSPLARRLRDVAEQGDVDVVVISRLNFMIGSPVRSAGWGPESDRLKRFYRKGAIEHSSRIHQGVPLRAGTRVLELPTDDSLSIWHFNYVDWDHFLNKLNRYTGVEAAAMIESEQPVPPALQVVKICGKEFLRRFVRQRGYKDGYRGAVLCLLMAMYRLMVFAKAQQLQDVGDSAAIRARYARIAAELGGADLIAEPSREG